MEEELVQRHKKKANTTYFVVEQALVGKVLVTVKQNKDRLT